MTQLGVKSSGYRNETLVLQQLVMVLKYVVSTMDRIKGAALSQNDNMLQMPIITAVADEAWSVKRSYGY